MSDDMICNRMLDGTCDPSAFCCSHAEPHEKKGQCEAPLCGTNAVKCIILTEKHAAVMRLLHGVKVE